MPPQFRGASSRLQSENFGAAMPHSQRRSGASVAPIVARASDAMALHCFRRARRWHSRYWASALITRFHDDLPTRVYEYFASGQFGASKKRILAGIKWNTLDILRLTKVRETIAVLVRICEVDNPFSCSKIRDLATSYLQSQRLISAEPAIIKRWKYLLSVFKDFQTIGLNNYRTSVDLSVHPKQLKNFYCLSSRVNQCSGKNLGFMRNIE